MGKVYLDREKVLCIKSEKSVFKSNGEKTLKFDDDEEFTIDAYSVSKLFSLFSSKEMMQLIKDSFRDEIVPLTSCWNDSMVNIFTSDEAVKKVLERAEINRKSYEDSCDHNDELRKKIYKLENGIKEHNELPWYKRFKKIVWQD